MHRLKDKIDRSSREGPIEDLEIILEVLTGDRNAYAEIVKRYQDRVRGYCASMLRDHTLADDAAQEVFIKAYQSLSKFRRESSFSTWLYRITANHCKDVLRKVIRRKSESWEALLEKEGDRLETQFAAPAQEPDTENAEVVTELLSKLPEDTRSILVLREVQGLSYQEIAVILNCTLDAVKSRLRRARQELAGKLRHFLKTPNV